VNPPGASGAEIISPVIAKPSAHKRRQPSSGDAAGDWLCSFCLNRVANEKDRFQYEGKDEFSFLNPQGIRFDIITFSHTLGCQQSGPPSLQFTWFDGHAWSYCVCDRCGQHLGWYYSGKQDFVGLIKTRILRALYIRN
jgi:hypothetical protein